MALRPEHFPVNEELPRFGRAQSASLGPTIRVLVWNILKAKRPDFASDFRTLAADRDLVLLQEAVRNAPSDPMFNDSRRHEWVMARSFRNSFSGRENGVKTGAVASVMDGMSWHSPHTEPVSQTRKVMLATRYRIAAPGEDASARAASTASLLVLNVHAINFVSVAKYADQIEQLGAALADHDGPIVLAGDFNTWNVKRRASLLFIALRAGLIEAPLVRRPRVSHLSKHLDHLLYRGLQLRTAQSIEHIRSSDHAPITATFDYRPAEG